MFTRRNSRFGWSVVAVLLAVSSAPADWPSFRGSNHDGISRETGFRKKWSDPIPLGWERTVGSAFSSFACVGDRVYTCGTQNRQQVLFCLNADSGQVIWQLPFEEEYRDGQGGDGTRATPTVDDGRVYILGARGKLLCTDADSGSTLWTQQFHHEPEWGYSGSVLIEGDLAIATGGRSEGALAAFDKRTGQRRWTCGDDPAGYATPYPFTWEGTRYLVGFTGTSLIIADAGNGNLVLRQPWETSYDVNAASPIFHDGRLWVGSGYDTGCGLFRLQKEADKLALQSIWKSKVLLNKFQSAILWEGKLYASDQKDLVCVDFLTGAEQWRQRRARNGTIVLADGHLLFLNEDGKLQIAPVSPKGFEPLTTADVLSGRCWTVPVLHRGKLYARNLERVVCFNLNP